MKPLETKLAFFRENWVILTSTLLVFAGGPASIYNVAYWSTFNLEDAPMLPVFEWVHNVFYIPIVYVVFCAMSFFFFPIRIVRVAKRSTQSKFDRIFLSVFVLITALVSVLLGPYSYLSLLVLIVFFLGPKLLEKLVFQAPLLIVFAIRRIIILTLLTGVLVLCMAKINAVKIYRNVNFYYVRSIELKEGKNADSLCGKKYIGRISGKIFLTDFDNNNLVQVNDDDVSNISFSRIKKGPFLWDAPSRLQSLFD